MAPIPGLPASNLELIPLHGPACHEEAFASIHARDDGVLNRVGDPGKEEGKLCYDPDSSLMKNFYLFIQLFSQPANI